MDDIAIRVDHVSKVFKLPHERQSSIKGVLINMFKSGKKNYERQEVLKDISFEIKKGEFFGIVGRNGSGKSTLLKMLAGIYTPTSGNIQVNGKLTPFIELGVGFNPELTGRENIFLNGALLGFNRSEMNAMYKDIVAFAELERFMDQKLKNYSSGMQVRLAFSIAIRAQNDILVLDEVLAVGDVSFQQKCFDVFRSIKKTGRTIVFVSHDLASMEEFCDRIVLIDKGRQITIGKPGKVILEYETIMAGGDGVKAHRSQTGRPGTGEYSIENVSILDTHGKKVTTLREYEEFAISIAYRRNKNVKELVCGFGIIDTDGVSIIGPNTKEAKIPLSSESLSNSGTITATFTTNLLAAGTYTVNVGFFNEAGTTPYDFYTEATKFKLIGKGRHGKVAIEPKWSIHKATK